MQSHRFFSSPRRCHLGGGEFQYIYIYVFDCGICIRDPINTVCQVFAMGHQIRSERPFQDDDFVNCYEWVCLLPAIGNVVDGCRWPEPDNENFDKLANTYLSTQNVFIYIYREREKERERERERLVCGLYVCCRICDFG